MECTLSNSSIFYDKKRNKNSSTKFISTDQVQTRLILKTRTERRCGKDYLIIDEVSPGSNSLVSAAHSEIDFKYDDAHRAVNGFINQVAKTRFQTCKGIMDHRLDTFIGEIYKTFFARIFDKMAIQDLFCVQ